MAFAACYAKKPEHLMAFALVTKTRGRSCFLRARPTGERPLPARSSSSPCFPAGNVQVASDQTPYPFLYIYLRTGGAPCESSANTAIAVPMVPVRTRGKREDCPEVHMIGFTKYDGHSTGTVPRRGEGRRAQDISYSHWIRHSPHTSCACPVFLSLCPLVLTSRHLFIYTARKQQERTEHGI
jgi:hypothetical protein